MDTPTAAVPDLLTQALGPGLKLNISATLPGEQLFVALIQAWSAARANMNQANRDGWDALVLEQAKDLQSVWRGLWVMLGVLK